MELKTRRILDPRGMQGDGKDYCKNTGNIYIIYNYRGVRGGTGIHVRPATKVVSDSWVSSGDGGLDRRAWYKINY